MNSKNRRPAWSPVISATSPYAVPLATLEQQAHVPLDEQVTERSPDAENAAWAWDEQRRQAQLAGGA